MKQNINNLLLKSKNDLILFEQILKKWQKAVNLISPSTINDIWNRHIIDSAQLYFLIELKDKILIDMGSGAGFPAIVLAIINKNENGPIKNIILIESDNKKCLFLKEVSRQLNLSIQIINNRIENVSELIADVITARALSSLNELLKYSVRFCKSSTKCLFFKGEKVEDEIQNCSIKCKIEKVKSITNTNSSILKITEIK